MERETLSEAAQRLLARLNARAAERRAVTGTAEIIDCRNRFGRAARSGSGERREEGALQPLPQTCPVRESRGVTATGQDSEIEDGRSRFVAPASGAFMALEDPSEDAGRQTSTINGNESADRLQRVTKTAGVVPKDEG